MMKNIVAAIVFVLLGVLSVRFAFASIVVDHARRLLIVRNPLRTLAVAGERAELGVEVVAAAGGVDDDHLRRLVGQVQKRVPLAACAATTVLGTNRSPRFLRRALSADREISKSSECCRPRYPFCLKATLPVLGVEPGRTS